MGAGRDLFARRKDGTEFQVEIGLNPIDAEDGIHVLTVIVDITERKRAEIEAQRHRQELAHLSRVFAMGELTASIAHELNQPLTAILSNAQAAQRLLAVPRSDLQEIKDILHDIVSCRIPDDHISVSRLPLFSAREVLRSLVEDLLSSR